MQSRGNPSCCRLLIRPSCGIPPETLQLPLSVFEPAKCNFRNPGIRAILSDNWRHCLQRRPFSFFGVVAKRHLEIKVSHNAYMLPHGGPAQKASCGLYPHLASGAVGGRRGRKGCRKNGADLQARTSDLQLHTTKKKTKSLFFQKSPAGGFFFWTYCIFSANF